jgi:hypothetical protein
MNGNSYSGFSLESVGAWGGGTVAFEDGPRRMYIEAIMSGERLWLVPLDP